MLLCQVQWLHWHQLAHDASVEAGIPVAPPIDILGKTRIMVFGNNIMLSSPSRLLGRYEIPAEYGR